MSWKKKAKSKLKKLWRRTEVEARSLYYSITYIPHGIRKVLAYAPVIYNLVEFDYHGMLRLHAFSLRRLYRELERGHCYHGKKKLRKLKVVIEIMERHANDDDLWAVRQWERVCGVDFLSVGFLGERPMTNYESRLFMTLVRMKAEKYKNERELMYKILAKHGESFWD